MSEAPVRPITSVMVAVSVMLYSYRAPPMFVMAAGTNLLDAVSLEGGRERGREERGRAYLMKTL